MYIGYSALIKCVPIHFKLDFVVDFSVLKLNIVRTMCKKPNCD